MASTLTRVAFIALAFCSVSVQASWGFKKRQKSSPPPPPQEFGVPALKVFSMTPFWNIDTTKGAKQDNLYGLWRDQAHAGGRLCKISLCYIVQTKHSFWSWKRSRESRKFRSLMELPYLGPKTLEIMKPFEIDADKLEDGGQYMLEAEQQDEFAYSQPFTVLKLGQPLFEGVELAGHQKSYRQEHSELNIVEIALHLPLKIQQQVKVQVKYAGVDALLPVVPAIRRDTQPDGSSIFQVEVPSLFSQYFVEFSVELPTSWFSRDRRSKVIYRTPQVGEDGNFVVWGKEGEKVSE